MTGPCPSRTGRLSRRQFLGIGLTATAAFAGCLGDNEDQEGENTDDAFSQPAELDEDVPELSRIEDPPEAVYKPTHRSAMRMLGTVEAGDYQLRAALSYPHRFWLVSGTDRERVTPTGRGVHLMLTVQDSETGTVLPVDAGAETELRRDGEPVAGPISPWPMLSQRMGFHFGDNIPLQTAGTYTVEVTLNPSTARQTGAFTDRFGRAETATFEFEYNDKLAEELAEDVTYLDESEWGEPGAVAPMGGGEMDGESGVSEGSEHAGHGPSSRLPPAAEYPGTALGTPSSGDATFVVRYLRGHRLADGDDYLLVSPRTPYNRYPLPDMSLTVIDSEERTLVQTLDSELGHHYGTPVGLSPGDTFEVFVNAPPQIARHRGYETAFLRMEPMSVEVPQR